MKTVSIVIPAYNEEKRIEKTLRGYVGFFDKLRQSKTLDYRILVVINNTTDNTEGVVKQFMKKNKRVFYLNLVKRGKGRAVLRGFKEEIKQHSDYIGFVDADMATPPKEFYRLVKEIKNADGIIANRYHKKSIVHPAFTLRRLLVGKCFNLLVRLLLLIPDNDTQCGAKLFTLKATKQIVKDVVMSEWAFDVEILYKLRKKGFVIRESPTEWTDVSGSRVDIIKDSMQMFMAIVQMRVSNSPFKQTLYPARPIIDIFWKIIR